MNEGNQARIDQIWAEIARLEKQKGEGVSMQTQEQIDAQIKGLDDERALLESEQQTQKIEEKVASIELPYDFNDLYENSTANDTIIEIVQQFKRQDLVEHNAEIQQLLQVHKDDLRASSDREMQLQRQNKALQNDLTFANEKFEEIKSKNAELGITISELQLELQEVSQSRDNAALQIEELKLEIERLKSHNDDLVKEQAVGAREAHKVIETNQTLNQLIEKATAEKQAKIKSAAELVLENGIPFRGKVELPNAPQQEYPFQGIPAIESADAQFSLAEATQTVEVPTFQTSDPTDVQGIPTTMAQGLSSEGGASGETPITRAEFESRLSQLKNEILADVRGVA